MILIVDDDPSVRASLELLLKQNGYASETAAGPEDHCATLLGLVHLRIELPQLVVDLVAALLNPFALPLAEVEEVAHGVVVRRPETTREPPDMTSDRSTRGCGSNGAIPAPIEPISLNHRYSNRKYALVLTILLGESVGEVARGI